MNKFKLIKFALAYSIKKRFSILFKKPLLVSMNLTASCNSKCKYCLAWKNKDTTDLSTIEWKKIISDLKNEFGLFFLTFTGGEPFIRKDILEIVGYASKKGLPVNLITNATLINKRIIDKIVSSGLYELTISLDCIKRDTYKNTRGIKKFDTVISNIRYINKKKQNLKLKIAAIISRYNLTEIVDLVNFVKKENLSIVFQPITPRPWSKDLLDPYWYKQNELWPELNDVEKIIDQLIILKKRGYPIINSVKYLELMKNYFNNPNQLYNDISPVCYRLLRIRSNGDVKLCYYLPKIGNLKKHRINDILNLEHTRAMFKKIGKCGWCILQNCNFEDD